MTDTETQLQIFAEAIELLGGQGASAAALKINERTLRKLLAGDKALHAGFLEDMSNALLTHAARIREVERRLNPGFAANLTERQREPLHGNALRNREAR